jgi:hypothetical protein
MGDPLPWSFGGTRSGGDSVIVSIARMVRTTASNPRVQVSPYYPSMMYTGNEGYTIKVGMGTLRGYERINNGGGFTGLGFRSGNFSGSDGTGDIEGNSHMLYFQIPDDTSLPYTDYVRLDMHPLSMMMPRTSFIYDITCDYPDGRPSAPY